MQSKGDTCLCTLRREVGWGGAIKNCWKTSDYFLDVLSIYLSFTNYCQDCEREIYIESIQTRLHVAVRREQLLFR